MEGWVPPESSWNDCWPLDQSIQNGNIRMLHRISTIWSPSFVGIYIWDFGTISCINIRMTCMISNHPPVKCTSWGWFTVALLTLPSGKLTVHYGNGHRNIWFTSQTGCFSIVLRVNQRVPQYRKPIHPMQSCETSPMTAAERLRDMICETTRSVNSWRRVTHQPEISQVSMN